MEKVQLILAIANYLLKKILIYYQFFQEISPNFLTGQAFEQAEEYLATLQNDPNLTNKMQLAFGDRFNAETAQKLVNDFAEGDFSAIPPIKIVDSQIINNAKGAFDSLNGVIYQESLLLKMPSVKI